MQLLHSTSTYKYYLQIFNITSTFTFNLLSSITSTIAYN